MLLSEVLNIMPEMDRKEINAYMAGNSNLDYETVARLGALEQAMQEELADHGKHWWLCKDKPILAYYQYKCGTLIIPYNVYMNAIQSTLGRTLTFDEVRSFSLSVLKELKRRADAYCKENKIEF